MLLVLEAMKMTRELRAPFRGRIEALRCEAGGNAEPGRPLVELTPIGEEA